MIIKYNNISKKIIVLLFVIFFLIGSITFKDYGISVDEEFHRSVGFYWLNHLLSFTPFEELNNSVNVKLEQIKGFTLPEAKTNSFYGVIFDLPIAFFEVIFKIKDPQKYFYLRHLLTFILFFISSIFFYKLLLNRFANYYVSLIGTLFFVLSPRIYGSSFFNNKDVVFLSLVTIALFYCFKALEKINYKNLLIFSFFAALCTSSRIVGIFLPISFIVFFFLALLSDKKNTVNLGYIIFFAIAYYFFLIIFWPFLWESPLENLALSFKYFSYMKGWNVKVFFNGEFIHSNFMQYNYILIWILITTPILYTIFFLIGYFQIFKRFFIKFINIKTNVPYYDLWRGTKEKKDLFVFFNITTIILYWITLNKLHYNGWRHLYFLNIFFIYIATYAFYQINIFLKSRIKKRALLGLVSFFFILVTYKMIAYHPYQNLYFNTFFSKSPHEKYEVDYWGLSGKKFLEDILILEKDKKPIKIGVASFLPLERSIKLLDKEDRKKIKIVGQEYQNADYLYSNFMSEVDKSSNDKYKIPNNFSKIDELIVNDTIVYQVFKKNN